MKILIVTLFFFLSYTHASTVEYYAIIHKDNPIESISKKDCKRILLKKKTSWKNGKKITPFVFDLTRAENEWILKDILQMTYGEWERYWVKKKFQDGKVEPNSISRMRILNLVGIFRGAIVLSDKAYNHPRLKSILIK